MKRIIAIVFTFCIAVCGFAQNTVTHIVQRAETIQSIAKTYGVSVEDIQNSNPTVKNVFYVGMKLTIPQGGDRVGQTKTETNDTDSPKVPQSNPEITSQSSTNGIQYVFPGDEGSYKRKTYNMCFEMAYIAAPKPEGFTGSAFGFLTSIGVNYRITDSFYAGARLGYMYSGGSYGYKTESSLHSLVLPIEIGYSISTENKKFALIPVAGIMPQVSIAGKSEINGEEHKIDTGKFDIALNVGLRIRLWEFNLSAQYIFQKAASVPGSSSSLEGAPLFSLGCGF